MTARLPRRCAGCLGSKSYRQSRPKVAALLLRLSGGFEPSIERADTPSPPKGLLVAETAIDFYAIGREGWGVHPPPEGGTVLT